MIGLKQDPERPHETVGVANEKTSYYLYDQGDGLFLVTVRIKKGLGTTNYQIREACKSLEEAKAVCAADFAVR